MVHEALFVHHILQYFFCRLEVIPCPVKCLLAQFNSFILLCNSIEKWMFWIFYIKILKAYSAVILLSGSNWSIWVSKSESSGVICGKSFSHFCLVLFGKDFMYLIASSFVMYLMSLEDGVPKTEIILWTWSRKSSPGKSAVFPRSSAAMQPTDQISIALLY